LADEINEYSEEFEEEDKRRYIFKKLGKEITAILKFNQVIRFLTKNLETIITKE